MLVDHSTRNSFLWRFTAVNVFGFALLVAAFHQGWVSQIYAVDTYHLTSIIGITFLVGLIVSAFKAWKLNQMWNDFVDSLPWTRKWKPESFGLRLSGGLQIISLIATAVLLLGFAGTMIGIIQALKSTEAFSTSDQASMTLAIVMLFKGVYVKFYASLVGILGHLWIITNYNMLTTMGRRLLARLTENA